MKFTKYTKFELIYFQLKKHKPLKAWSVLRPVNESLTVIEIFNIKIADVNLILV